MSVHSNHYDTYEEYERDLKAEYSKAEYHDDPHDDPCCGNCKYFYECADTFEDNEICEDYEP